MKTTFKIDIFLAISFILTATTGIGNHIAGHGGDHHVWVIWSAVHILAAASFLFLAVWHVKIHKGWYKSMLKNSAIRRKGRVTMLITAIFAICTLTGLVLLGIIGGNSPVGLWHYRFGLLMTLLAICHFAKRFKVFRKGILAAWITQKGQTTPSPSGEA